MLVKPIRIPIKDYEGLYSIQDDGKVWSHRNQKFLKPRLLGRKGNQYFAVALCKNGKRSSKKIHKLLADHFIYNDDPENKTQCNHKDGNKLNNALSNLEHCTHSENVQHAWDIGLHEKTREAVRKNGRENGIKHSSKPVLCNELFQTYPSASYAARDLGPHCPNISSVCLGKIKTTGGYTFCYVSDL